MKNYSKLLRSYQLKATPQRIAIAQALDLHGHLSIEQIYAILKERFSSLSLATIYKNINIMIENAFISEVKLPEQKSVYELTKESHSHLQCKVCHKVWDIYLDLDDIVDSASKGSSFEIESASLVLSGVCQECQKLR
ncbi:Peroxide stress regulator; Ferric uptake regulation protein; Fe2+/Zn2+ uptake regulation proteins [hydrothermal vent metagenome]|uniref:Peroxide stress regulator Ferric uptake regulation protein Fe2+/Zn2+ uptake regulation proteins n=1 Tax=hydrothermal vent metagenome TaxID=652676 RepID=A0A1W1BYS8_9ZZZZ